MFMPWCCRRDKVIVRVHPVYLMNIARRQVAACPPSDRVKQLGRESDCIVYVVLNLRLIGYSFTVPRRVEG